jgi:hypothetical protein
VEQENAARYRPLCHAENADEAVRICSAIYSAFERDPALSIQKVKRAAHVVNFAVEALTDLLLLLYRIRRPQRVGTAQVPLGVAAPGQRRQRAARLAKPRQLRVDPRTVVRLLGQLAQESGLPERQRRAYRRQL